MFTWLLRLLGIVVHEVTCLLCKRKVVSESGAVAANWLHTLAGWECNECVSRVMRAPKAPRL